MVRRVIVVGGGAGLLAIAACAQVLGIQDVHDDPADSGHALDATALDGATLPDVSGPDVADSGAPSADSSVGYDAGNPTDAAIADRAVDVGRVPDPSLACPRGDGGPTQFLAVGGASFHFAIDGQYLYAAPPSSVLRCSIEGCEGGAPAQISQDSVADITTNGRDVIWSATQGFAALVIATPDGTSRGGQLVTKPGAVAAVGSDVWTLDDGIVIHAIDDPSGVDASSPPFYTPTTSTTYQRIAASPSYVAFSEPDDAGTDIFVCPRSGCADGAAPLWYVDSTSNGFPFVVAVDDQNVYFTDPVANVLESCPVSGCGGTPTVLTPNVSTDSIVPTPAGLYWAGQNGGVNGVYRTPYDGGKPLVVVATTAPPVEVRVNDTCVYWSIQTFTAPQKAVVFAVPTPP